jgi:hypothetical protein
MPEIDKFKSVISKRGGLAPQNRFAVYMAIPLISFEPQDLIAKFFDQGANTGNGIFGLNDPRDVSILCDSVTMPGRQVATAELQNNMLTKKFAYGYMNDDVTFSFHITNDHFMKKYFEKWFNQIVDRRSMTLKYKAQYSTDIIIQQLDQRDVPVYTCTLKNAFPTTVASYDLTNSGENQTQRMSITMAYDDWSEEGFVESILSKGSVLLGSIGKTFGF